MGLPQSNRSPDDFDDILGELDALSDKDEHPSHETDDFDDILAELSRPEPQGEVVPAAAATVSLEDILGEFSAPEVAADDPAPDLQGHSTDIAPHRDGLATAPKEDDLDDILGEFAGLSIVDDAPVTDGPGDGLDSILDDLDQSAATVDIASATTGMDYLDEALDDIAPIEPDETIQPVSAAPEAAVHVGEEIAALSAAAVVPGHEVSSDIAEAPSGSVEHKPRAARRWLPAVAKALAGLAVLGGTNGLSYYLGTKAATTGHAAARTRVERVVEKPAPPAPRGVERYVGFNVDVRIGGKTVLQDDEIRTAIAGLDGGMDLQQDIDAASRRFTSIVPTALKGSVIAVEACNKADCQRDAIKLQYNTASRQIAVCLTKPYSDGAKMSYAFDRSGFREVAGCIRPEAGVIVQPGQGTGTDGSPKQSPEVVPGHGQAMTPAR